MYSGLKYLFKNVISCANSNNELSGGLPHSEIHGSKPILGSPWLIAEYHVFHRLLLPRHSPNALLALDLIQKETDLFVRYRAERYLSAFHAPPHRSASEHKVHRWSCGKLEQP